MTSYEEQRARPVNAEDLLEVARAQGSIPMTDLAAASERHQEAVWEDYSTTPPTLKHTGECVSDDEPWKCDAALFRDALDEAWRAYHAALAVAQGELDAERDRADKAEADLNALLCNGPEPRIWLEYKHERDAERAIADELQKRIAELEARP